MATQSVEMTREQIEKVAEITELWDGAIVETTNMQGGHAIAVIEVDGNEGRQDGNSWLVGPEGDTFDMTDPNAS